MTESTGGYLQLKCAKKTGSQWSPATSKRTVSTLVIIKLQTTQGRVLSHENK